MASKPLTTESIALTEKKMDMALDDIIKLSKTATTKPTIRQRDPNINNKFVNNHTQDNKAMKVRRFMDSRSSLRQGAIAQRRSSFQGNRFPSVAEVARKAAVAPIHNRAFTHNRVANWNRQRVGLPVVHRRPANGGFPSKQQQQQPEHKSQKQRHHQTQPRQQQWNTVPKQRPQTLDSLFANMKEQRMRVISHQNNVVPHNGGGQLRLPWIRRRNEY